MKCAGAHRPGTRFSEDRLAPNRHGLIAVVLGPIVCSLRPKSNVCNIISKDFVRSLIYLFVNLFISCFVYNISLTFVG